MKRQKRIKKINDWTHDFSRTVNGLEYSFPFAVGDHVIMAFKELQTDELFDISKKYIMKVIQIGVPVQVVNKDSHIDVFGDVSYEPNWTFENDERPSPGNFVEGVRAQLLYHLGDVYEDMGHGFKENLPVSSLQLVDRPAKVVTKTVNESRNLQAFSAYEKLNYERKRKRYNWD